MPTINLTDISIRAIKPPENGQVTFWDTQIVGFNIRASQGGTLTYSLVYGANRKRVSLGRVGIVSLKDARKKARDILAEHQLNGHKVPSITFEDAREMFLKTGQWKPSTAKENRRLLGRHFEPILSRPINELRTSDIMEIIDQLLDTPSEAAHAFAVVKALTRWCAGRGYFPDLRQSIKKPGKSMASSRVLDDAELAALLNVASTAGNYGLLLELLLLTGQRVGQFAPAFSGSIVNDRIVWPAKAMKGNRETPLPLTERVSSLLARLQQFNNFSTAHTQLLKAVRHCPFHPS